MQAIDWRAHLKPHEDDELKAIVADKKDASRRRKRIVDRCRQRAIREQRA